MALSVVMGILIASPDQQPFESPLPPRAYVPIVARDYVKPTPIPVGLKGVGIIHQEPFECADLEPLGDSITHLHNWKADPPDCPGVEPVCMWWCINNIGDPINPNCRVILQGNEPQISRQCNKTPAEYAVAWPNVEVSVGAHEFSTPCADFPWLNAWASAFYATNGRWPEFDYVCVHSYPYILPGMSVQDAIAQTITVVETAHTWSEDHGGDGRVWLHEFGLWPAWCPGEDCTTEYIEGVVPQLEALGVWYDWFALEHVGDYIAPPYDTSLVDGALTPYGDAYR